MNVCLYLLVIFVTVVHADDNVYYSITKSFTTEAIDLNELTFKINGNKNLRDVFCDSKLENQSSETDFPTLHDAKILIIICKKTIKFYKINICSGNKFYVCNCSYRINKSGEYSIINDTSKEVLAYDVKNGKIEVTTRLAIFGRILELELDKEDLEIMR